MKNKLILFVLAWLIGIMTIFFIGRQTSHISVLVYWIILGLFIFSVSLFKLSRYFILLFTFCLFIIAGLLTTLGFGSIAEIIMRISLLGWFVGLGKGIFEYFFKKK